MAKTKAKTDTKPASGGQPTEDEIPQEIKDAAGKLLSEIRRAKTLVKTFHETTLPSLRKHTWGTKLDSNTALPSTGDQGSTTRTNLTFATLATLLPHVYAKNPEISVSPTEAVGQDEYDAIKKFALTCQIMLNRCFVEEARLKERCKSNIRSAMTTSVGWLKMIFQKSLQGDPIVVRRAQDMQDNLRRIEFLLKAPKEGQDDADLNVKKVELEEQLKAVMSGTEIKIYKGFAIDRVQTEDVLILDESIVDFNDYVNAKKLGHRIWMTDEEYEVAFGGKPLGGATKFDAPVAGEFQDENGQKISIGDGVAKLVYRAVWEVWDRSSNTIYTVCEGATGWCRAPYQPKPAPGRWYSFFCLGFNLVEGRWRPLSDVELLRHLQDEYNTTRYLFAETRKESIPVRVFRKGGNLTDEDIANLSKRKARDWLGIEGNPSVPLEQDIMQLDGIKIDPQAFDVTIIRNDMDMLVGLSDASRANLIQAKTATEAEIMRQSLQTRVAERQDTNEDMVGDMARAAIEIMLQEFSEDEVKQICGKEAMWPKMAPEEIFTKINVTIRAGSTGRPNQQKDREAWATIMPIIKDTVQQVAELRLQGQDDMANTLIELLKETFKRYDERLDIDKFIPRQEMGPDGKPVAQANAIMEAQKTKEQLQLVTEELQKCKEALTKAQAGEQSTMAKIEADKVIAAAQESSKQAEAMAEAETEKTKQAAENAKAAAEETKRQQAQIDANAETRVEVEKERIKQEAADRDADRMMELKEFEILSKAASTLLDSEIKANASIEVAKHAAKAKANEEGAETNEAAPQQIDPAEYLKRHDDLVSQLSDLVGVMKQGRKISVKKTGEGQFEGESV